MQIPHLPTASGTWHYELIRIYFVIVHTAFPTFHHYLASKFESGVYRSYKLQCKKLTCTSFSVLLLSEVRHDNAIQSSIVAMVLV